MIFVYNMIFQPLAPSYNRIIEIINDNSDNQIKKNYSSALNSTRFNSLINESVK